MQAKAKGPGRPRDLEAATSWRRLLCKSFLATHDPRRAESGRRQSRPLLLPWQLLNVQTGEGKPAWEPLDTGAVMEAHEAGPCGTHGTADGEGWCQLYCHRFRAAVGDRMGGVLEMLPLLPPPPRPPAQGGWQPQERADPLLSQGCSQVGQDDLTPRDSPHQHTQEPEPPPKGKGELTESGRG